MSRAKSISAGTVEGGLAGLSARRVIHLALAIGLLSTIEVLRMSYLGSGPSLGPGVVAGIGIVATITATAAALVWMLSAGSHFNDVAKAMRFATTIVLVMAVTRGALDCIQLTAAALQWHPGGVEAARCVIEPVALLLFGAVLYDRARRACARRQAGR